MRALALLLTVLLAAGCDADPATEILLIVDSRVDAVDGIRVEVTHPDGDTSTSEADLLEEPAPRRLVLVHRGGAFGPVTLRVQGNADESPVVSTTRIVSFEEGKTIRVEVVLSPACVERDCGDEVCGNDGRCRAPEVQPCELEVGGCLPELLDGGPADASPSDGGASDAGAPDASPDASVDAGPPDASMDAGACEGFRVCGVSAVHLPGDFVAPRPCSGSSAGVRVSVTRGATPLPVFGGAAQVVRPGAYEARIETDTCHAESRFFVSGPTAYDLGDEPGALREIDGRSDSAVLVGSTGAFVMGDTGYVRIIGEGVAPGLHQDFSAVAYTSGGAWLGATGGHREYVFVPLPLGATTPVAVALDDPLRGAIAMGVPFGLETPVLYASAQGPAFLSSSSHPGALLDGRGVTWMTMGVLAEEGRGAVWTGNGAGLRNLATDARGVAFAGAQVTFDGSLGAVQTAAVDESAGVTSLWVCGREVHRYDLVGDLSGLTALPAPAVELEEDCFDLAIGDDGEVWVARRFGGILRVARDGAPILRYGTAQGLPGDPLFYRLDFGSDPAGRSLWLLSLPDRAVVRFSADPPTP